MRNSRIRARSRRCTTPPSRSCWAFGSRWCFKLQEQILLEPLSGQTVFPSLECALLSSDMAWRRLVMVDHARYLREKAGQGVGAVQYELRPFESGRGVQVTPSSGIEHARQSSPP